MSWTALNRAVPYLLTTATTQIETMATTPIEPWRIVGLGF
jgi:hypothetical protein